MQKGPPEGSPFLRMVWQLAVVFAVFAVFSLVVLHLVVLAVLAVFAVLVLHALTSFPVLLLCTVSPGFIH